MAIQKSWDDFPYKVFVSYSQRDKSWGEWLEAKLEAYRIPKKLHGRWTPFGLVPEQIKPVFRDRTGLGAEHSLEKAIEARLDDSATLVVICSPNAAGSPYVDAEVRHFKASGKSDRVFAFIVDGEPGDADRDPFVPALKSRVDARTGELTEEPDEPIAADAREIADGRENAFLKLVAGLLGVDLTDLQEKTNEILEREAARARLVRNIVAALGVLAVVFGALGFQQRNVALRNETRIVARAASDLSTKGQHVEAVALALEAMPTAKGALMPRPPSPYAEAIIRGALMSNALARLLPRASAISPDGRWAFRNGENGWTLVDLATGDPTTLSLGDDPTIADAQFSPDSARLVAPKYDGTVVVFDVAAPARPRFLSDERFKPKDYVFIRDFSAGGSVVWLVTRDQAALWDLESGALLVASEDLSAAYGAKLSDDGRILRLKDDENGARVLALTDIRTGVDVAQFIVSEDDAPDTDDRNGIVWADLSHDGLTAAASTPEGALHVWRLDAIDASDPATAGDDASGGAREDETGESETGEDETETNAQDVPRLTPTFTLRNSGYRGGPLAFSPSGRKIATAGWSEAALRIWSVEPNGDVIQVDGAEVTDAYPLTIAFSEDESLLARMTETCGWWSGYTFRAEPSSSRR